MVRPLVLALLLAVLTAPARADPVLEALRSGGVAVLLRHAQTVPGVGDPPGFKLDDCATQRNLSDEGRAQSQRIGAWFKRRDVRVDQVLSSRWCRCLDTARLAFAPMDVQPFPALDSFFDDRGRAPAQTEAVLRHLRDLKPPRNVVLVTHMVNIAALTGQTVTSGESIVVRPTAGGALEVLGRILVD